MRLSDKVQGNIASIKVHDVRFPTSLEKHGSDAIHGDPDYSAVVAILTTDSGAEGHGMTFTLGRGNEIIRAAVDSLIPFVLNRNIREIFENFGKFWKSLTCEEQLRWVGPEKGVIHMATAAIINGLWDLWARLEEKPVWKLVTDMTPEEIISLVDFGWITDELTPDQALEILKNNESSKSHREAELEKTGFPAYQTAGWLNYEEQYLRMRLQKAKSEGWTRVKAKVGSMKPEDDARRLQVVREELGSDGILMIDANQRWDVQEAIDRVSALKEFKPLWIEEPTKDDDILGHAKIAEGLKETGIKVATGEQCQNRIVFKQLMAAGGVHFVQIDSCRVAGLNEIILILLLAKKFNLPVCPHAGGVGLCQMVAHIIMIDFISISASLENRYCEYSAHLHEHFEGELRLRGQNYLLPQGAGYSTKFRKESIEKFEFPNGSFWKDFKKSA